MINRAKNRPLFRRLKLSLFGAALAISSTSQILADERPEIGVLMASHGDIDDYKTELEEYIKISFQKNVGIPFPFWMRSAITQPAYLLAVNKVTDQYKQIGPTYYRANSQKQIEAITVAMQEMGLNAKAYMGFNFAHPLIEETLATMQKDGIKQIIVFNQGFQFSFASSGENIGDVRDYLKHHPEWEVEVIGLRQYSEDLRAREVWAEAIEKDLKEHFPSERPQDVCILVGSHGLPEVMTKDGDPAIPAMKRAVAWLKERLPEYHIYHGFLNDDFIPGATWAAPRASLVAKAVRDDGCPNVLMDARLSFTVHHRATLYDLNIEVRNVIEEPDYGPNGEPHPLWVKPKVILASQFDGDSGYAKLMAQLADDALLGHGDLEVIQTVEEGLLPRPHYPVKSKYIRY